MVAASLLFAGGCSSRSAEVATPVFSASSPEVVTNTEASLTVAPAVDVADVEVLEVDPAQAEVRAVEQPTSPAIQLTGPATELARMAQSGVEETVMLAYVTNSASLFNLSADHVIYLSDIGVPSSVLTAMIQQDTQVKFSSVAAPTAAVELPTPAPAEVAPQPDASAAPAAVQPGPNVAQGTFETSLSPYGTWYEVEGYGRVWQPTVVVVNTGWQPYFHGGRWIWSDYGWYWYSDYSWGWAPFHYGRWFRHHRIGWCWAPDTIWGPSWVTWRYNDAYCGWAPLPPAAWYRPGFGFTYYGRSIGLHFDFGLGPDCYAYIPARHFGAHRLHHHAVPRHHVDSIHRETSIANRMVAHKNTTIVNEGIPPSYVAKATGKKLNRVTVRETGTPGERPERMADNGKSVAVYRPAISGNESRLTSRPQAVSGSSSPRGAGAIAGMPLKASQPAIARPASQDSRLTQRPAPAIPRPVAVQARPDVAPGSVDSTRVTKATVPAKEPAPLIMRGTPPVRETPAQPMTPTRPTSVPQTTQGTRPSTPVTQPGAVQPVSPTRPTPSAVGSGDTGRGLNTRPALQPTRPAVIPSSSSSRLTERPSVTMPAPSAVAPTYKAPAPTRNYTPTVPVNRAPAVQAPSRPAPAYQAPVVPAPSRPTPSYQAPARITPQSQPQTAPRMSTPINSAPSIRPTPAPVAPSVSVSPRSAPSSGLQSRPSSVPQSSGSRMTERNGSAPSRR